jgi:chromosomal replication initiation ATPase DnaA
MAALIELMELIPKEKQNDALNLLNSVKKFHQEKERMTKVMQKQLVDRIILSAAVAWDVPVTSVLSKSRRQPLVFARTFIYSQLVRTMQFSKVRVAEIFKQNHATVISGLNTFDNLLVTDREFKSNYNNFLKLLSNDKPSIDVPKGESYQSSTPTDVFLHRTVDN